MSKLLEHIIVSKMMSHLVSNSILVSMDFDRSSCVKHSWSLLLMNNGIETDVIAMNLSKAFTTEPHKRLMEMLKLMLNF